MTLNHKAPLCHPENSSLGPERAGDGSPHLARRVRLKDLHVIHRTVLGVCLHHAHSIHHPYTLAHTAKNGMFAVQPLRGGQSHEELAAVGVWSCIGHCENPSPWGHKEREEREQSPSSWQSRSTVADTDATVTTVRTHRSLSPPPGPTASLPRGRAVPSSTTPVASMPLPPSFSSCASLTAGPPYPLLSRAQQGLPLPGGSSRQPLLRDI